MYNAQLSVKKQRYNNLIYFDFHKPCVLWTKHQTARVNHLTPHEAVQYNRSVPTMKPTTRCQRKALQKGTLETPRGKCLTFLGRSRYFWAILP